MIDTPPAPKKKPYEDDLVLDSALMADSRTRKARICMTGEDDPARAAVIDKLWRRLERESKRRQN